MNLVERWFAELTAKWVRRGAHRSVADLTAAVERWVDDWNENPRPFVWHKTADQILKSLAGYLNHIPDSGTKPNSNGATDRYRDSAPLSALS